MSNLCLFNAFVHFCFVVVVLRGWGSVAPVVFETQIRDREVKGG